MKFIDALNIVRGALAKKDLMPVLTHFHIYNNRIQGSNGRVSVDCSCDLFEDIILTVPGNKFLLAMDAISNDKWSHTVDNDSIVLIGIGTEIKLPLSQADFPLSICPDKFVKISMPLLPALEKLLPFIGQLENKVELCSVYIKGGFAYATNTIILARVPIQLPDMVIPIFIIDELLRIAIEPVGVHIAEQLITFKISKSTWLQSVLFTGPWPNVTQFFEPCKIKRIKTDEIIAAVNIVINFCEDEKKPKVFFTDQGITTGEGIMEALVDKIKLPTGIWNAKNLLVVLKEATHINFQDWPQACRWKGDGIEGVIVGIKK